MVTDSNNPSKDRVLPCTMSTAIQAQMRIAVKTASPGLSLAEMTGKFHTKEEATITQMMRLIIKMSLLGHPASCPKELYGELYEMLNKARIRYWGMQYLCSDNAIAKPGFVAQELHTLLTSI